MEDKTLRADIRATIVGIARKDDVTAFDGRMNDRRLVTLARGGLVGFGFGKHGYLLSVKSCFAAEGRHAKSPTRTREAFSL